ncbi:hypothetical protein OKW27_002340 [Paraburkholderia sp. 35.1]
MKCPVCKTTGLLMTERRSIETITVRTVEAYGSIAASVPWKASGSVTRSVATNIAGIKRSARFSMCSTSTERFGGLAHANSNRR